MCSNKQDHFTADQQVSDPLPTCVCLHKHRKTRNEAHRRDRKNVEVTYFIQWYDKHMARLLWQRLAKLSRPLFGKFLWQWRCSKGEGYLLMAFLMTAGCFREGSSWIFFRKTLWCFATEISPSCVGFDDKPELSPNRHGGSLSILLVKDENIKYEY